LTVAWRSVVLGDAQFVGSRRGIVYIGCSRVARLAYIGQTGGASGVLGRWSHHLSASASSFWRRVEERGECDPGDITDLVVFAAELGPESHWNGIEASHREAVEYLLQVKLHTVSGELNPFLRVVSFVRPNTTCQLPFVRDRADSIFDEFIEWYSE